MTTMKEVASVNVRLVDTAIMSEQNSMIEITRRAFHNNFQPGADEHYLLHLLQSHPDFIPDLYLGAFLNNGQPVGCIAFSESKIYHPDGTTSSVCTFGPISVDPEFQGKRIGRKLVDEGLRRARETGKYAGCVIMGDPRLYGRYGFRCAERYDLTTPDGFYACAMMAVEFTTLSAGKFVESEVFSDVSVEAADRWDMQRGAAVLEKVVGTASQKEFELMTTLKYKPFDA